MEHNNTKVKNRNYSPFSRERKDVRAGTCITTHLKVYERMECGRCASLSESTTTTHVATQNSLS